jgi:DNA-binding beta-propeller fold protein YncE
MSSQTDSVVVGNSRFQYEAQEHWAQLPPSWSFNEVVGVATDSRDRVFAFNRGEHPVIVFDRDGKFLHSWGEGIIVRAHGIHIGPDDAVYLTDDRDHTVRKFTADGRLLLTLGTRGVASDTGCENSDYRTIKRGAGPFNQPTNLALAPDGSIYITDGYGNARVHQFTPAGGLVVSWGEPGAGPGQFNLPHGIAVDRDSRVYVADRENSRVQIFDAAGNFLTEWGDLARPTEVTIVQNDDGDELVLVSEIGFRCGLFPGTVAPPNAAGSRVSILTRDGKLLCRWGGGPDPCATGDFFAAHDIWVDSRGDIYVSEVTLSAGGNRGAVPPTCHTLQKFWRMG